MGKAPYGMNPVTIAGRDKVNLTLGRLWVGMEGEPFNKLITALVWKGEQHNEAGPHEVLGATVLNEHTFLDGLSQLFPAGETDAHSESVARINYDLVNLLKRIRQWDYMDGGWGDCAYWKEEIDELLKRIGVDK